MALTTESAGKVRQRAYNAVYGSGTGTTTDSVSPYHFYAVKSFFLHWAANKGNADLQFIPYTAEQAIDAVSGTSLVGSACTLYVWFAKARRTTGTTAAFETLWDGTSLDTTGDSDVLGQEIAVQQVNLTGQQFLLIHPNGYVVTTDVSVVSTTTIDGFTQSATADSTDGFIIVGA